MLYEIYSKWLLYLPLKSLCPRNRVLAGATKNQISIRIRFDVKNVGQLPGCKSFFESLGNFSFINCHNVARRPYNVNYGVGKKWRIFSIFLPTHVAYTIRRERLTGAQFNISASVATTVVCTVDLEYLYFFVNQIKNVLSMKKHKIWLAFAVWTWHSDELVFLAATRWLCAFIYYFRMQNIRFLFS